VDGAVAIEECMKGFPTKRATLALLALAAVLPLTGGSVCAQVLPWANPGDRIHTVERLPAPAAATDLPMFAQATAATYPPPAFPGSPTAQLVAYEATGSAPQAFSQAPPPGGNYVDYDAYLQASEPPPAKHFMDLPAYAASEPWHWQILPSGLIFDSYLADTKESRLAGHVLSISPGSTYWDGILGARIGLVRYGTTDPHRPVGFQIDVEGSGQVRLDIPNDVDVSSVDFRAGIPITFGWGRHRTRLGYYHLSSHLGDEFLLKNPDYDRLNYARDVLYIGHAIYLTPEWRIYGQAGWAFYTDVSQPWEFQFGVEYAPAGATGIHGAPFFAVNGHLREEVDYGGSLTVETGWAWRGDSSGMLRMGLLYFNGQSNQYSFYNQFQQQIGFGVWYDF
jgi:hypothetical protein